MKKSLSLLAATLTSAALLLCTASAEAGPVHWDLSIGVPLPIWIAPAPVYVQPAPVYVQPRPVVDYGNSGYYYGYQPTWREHEWREHHDWREHHEWHERGYDDNRWGDHHDHYGHDHHGHD